MSKSHNPDKENLWGKKGCQLPNGRLCIACCTVKGVTEMEKPPYTNCTAQTVRGCQLQGTADQPTTCMIYHCSMDINRINEPGIRDQLTEMVMHELNRGAVTTDDARKALGKLG